MKREEPGRLRFEGYVMKMTGNKDDHTTARILEEKVSILAQIFKTCKYIDVVILDSPRMYHCFRYLVLMDNLQEVNALSSEECQRESQT